jgi:hypothetical protein
MEVGGRGGIKAAKCRQKGTQHTTLKWDDTCKVGLDSHKRTQDQDRTGQGGNGTGQDRAGGGVPKLFIYE